MLPQQGHDYFSLGRLELDRYEKWIWFFQHHPRRHDGSVGGCGNELFSHRRRCLVDMVILTLHGIHHLYCASLKLKNCLTFMQYEKSLYFPLRCESSFETHMNNQVLTIQVAIIKTRYCNCSVRKETSFIIATPSTRNCTLWTSTVTLNH